MTSDHPSQEDIMKALKDPVDYSRTFTGEVAGLCSQLSASLNAPLTHDDHMDYRASQSLTLWYDSRSGAPVPSSSDADWGLEAFISSKAKYFTFSCRRKQVASQSALQLASIGAKDTWVSSPLPVAPERVKEYEAAIKEDLVRRGYAYLSLDTLQDLAVDHLTNLDQLPATYFEVFFSEID